MELNGKFFLTLVLALAVSVAGFCFTENAVASPEKVTLIFWDTTKPEAEAKAMQKNWDRYMKAHPNVEIKEETFGGSLSEFDTKIKMAISVGKGPDFFKTHGVAFYPYFCAGFLKTPPKYLADYITEQAVNEALIRKVSDKGRFYAVPDAWHGLVVIYNKSMLAEAGLSSPPSDWDWNMMLDYAKRLTKYDSQRKVSRAGLSLRKTGHPQGICAKFSPFFFAAGVPKELTYWTEDLKKTIINTRPGREALQFYVDALYKYKIDSLQVKSDYMGFSERTVAMFHRGFWVTAYFKEYAPDIDFGIALVPKLEFPQFADNIISGNSYGVTRDCKHLDEVWDVLFEISQPESHAYFATESVNLPTYKNAAQREEFQKNPFYQIAMSQRGRAEAHISTVYELENIIGRYIEKACYKTLSVEEALKRAEEECNKILKETWK